MSSNQVSSVRQRINQQELAMRALYECVFHMKFRFRITFDNFPLYQLLWQAMTGVIAKSKVSRLRGDFEWGARQSNHACIPKPLSPPPFHHGFIIAPMTIQFHWLKHKGVVSANDILYRHIPYLFQSSCHHRYLTEKVIALAGCLCQLPCHGGCSTWEWLPLDVINRGILQTLTGMYAPALESCLTRNDQFYNGMLRMHLLRNVSEITVFPRECFYFFEDDVDDAILDMAYDVTIACGSITRELSVCLSWMLFTTHNPYF